MEKYNKQTIKIEKYIHEKGLIKLKKINKKITHQEDKELETLLSVKLLNLITIEVFLS